MKIRTFPPFFLSITLLLLHATLFGQEQQKYVLPLGEELLPGKQAKQPSAATIFDVVDLTGDSTLGYLPAPGNSNDRVAVYPPLAKQEWINALLRTAGIEETVKAGYSALLIITDISIGGNEKESYYKVKGSLYESPLGKEAFIKIKPINHFQLNRSSGLADAGNNLAGVIMASLSAAANPVIKNDGIRSQSEAEVIAAEKERLQFITKAVFPSGIYTSFDEFKALKPAYGQFYLKTDTLRKRVQVNGFTVGDSTMHPVDNAFAIAAGNELYLYKDGRLYPVETKGNNLILSKYVDPAIRRNQARFWSTSFGYLITGNYSNPFDNIYTIVLNDYGGQKLSAEAIKVSAENGQLEL